MDRDIRDRAVREWIRYNTGLSRGKEYDIYIALWQVGATVARSFQRSLDQSDLDDCIHDVMLKISQRSEIASMDYPSAYFCRSVRHACLDKLRAKSRRPEAQAYDAESESSWEESLPSQDAALDVLFEHEQCVDRLLAKLNAEQKQNLQLALDVRWDNLSTGEIATREGRSARAITQGVSNFVNVTLRKLLDEICPGLVAQVTGRH